MAQSFTSDLLLALLDGRIEQVQLGALPLLEEYRLLRPLGQGAMGRIFLAQDTLLDRTVAIKFLLRSGTDPQARERFLIEARAIARLSHPNVVSIHRVGEVCGQQYLVSEYVRGQSLDRLAKPLPWMRVREIGVELLRGLCAAHRRGVLHRDLKPANAILAEDGTVKLLDFGLAKLDFQSAALTGTISFSPDAKMSALAKTAPAHAVGALTESGALLGTPLYMAPELWRSEPATAQSDLYSIGTLLYELCAGRTPHTAESLELLYLAVQNQDAPPLRQAAPDVDARFARIVDRCLCRDPAKRPLSAEELLHIIESLEIETAPPSFSGDHDNPYRGLYSFESEHQAFFFGRRRELGELLERLRAEPMVLVAGDSGVGKSSLCRAGVLARVQAGALGQGQSRPYQIVTLFPGRHPVRSLADALAGALNVSTQELQAELSRAPADLVRRLHHHGSHHEHGGLFLFIDQFEELLSQSDPEEVSLVSELLGQLAEPSTSRVRVLLAARGDFLTRLAALPGIGRGLSRTLYLLSPLGREQLRDAIVQPAAAYGVRFESEKLIEQLISGTLRTDGGLPLLQFALAELWQARDVKRQQITEDALAQIGGVDGALAQHADRILQTLLPGQLPVAQRLLIALVSVSGLRVRRSADELLTQPGDLLVVETLVRGRLLVARAQAERTLYEIAHEALVQGWGTLHKWLESEAGRRLVRERIETAAAEWHRLGQAPEALWDSRRLSEVSTTGLDVAHLPALGQRFIAVSRKRLAHNRVLRVAALLAIPLLPLSLYAVARFQSARERQAQVAVHLRNSQEPLAAARRLKAEVTSLRRGAFTAFDTQKRTEGEKLWAEVLKHTSEMQRQYAQASQAQDMAAASDASRVDVKEQLARVLCERVGLAEQEHDPQQVEALKGRLAALGTKGGPLPCSTPARVRLAITPHGAHVRAPNNTDEASSAAIMDGLAKPAYQQAWPNPCYPTHCGSGLNRCCRLRRRGLKAAGPASQTALR